MSSTTTTPIKSSIHQAFEQSSQIIATSAAYLAPSIESAAERMIQALTDNKKILICGNGGSASDAIHLSAELLNRFEIERPALAAMALNTDIATLTAISNDYGYEHIYAKQIHGLGQSGDVLVVITTSGQSTNIIAAIHAAHENNIDVIAMNGKNGGNVAEILTPNDIEIRVPAQRTARIQEVHGLVIHCLCDIIDHQMFVQED